MKRANSITETIVRDTLEESPGELSSRNPMVLSCGGIYIPYNKRRLAGRPFWKMLNLADGERPVKVVTPGLGKSPLTELLEKESMN